MIKYNLILKKLPQFLNLVWELRYVLTILILVFSISIIGYFQAPNLKVFCRSHNMSILNKRISIPDIFTPSFDPILDRIFRESSVRKFDFSSSKSSPSVSQFLKEYPNHFDLTNSNYDSIFDLLREMYVNDDTKREILIFQEYIKPKLMKEDYISSLISPLFYYLETMYEEPIIELLKHKQFGRAAKYAERLNAIITTIDFPPLGVIDPYTQKRLNNLILLGMISSNSETLYSNIDTCLLLLLPLSVGFRQQPIYTNDQRATNIKNIILERLDQLAKYPNSNIYKLLLYWKGIYLIKSKKLKSEKYRQAWIVFRESASNHTVVELRQASLLMQARCVFWLFIDEVYDRLRYPSDIPSGLYSLSQKDWDLFLVAYKKSYNILMLLKENIIYSNYKSDINDYIKQIELKKEELSKYVAII